MDSNKVEAVSKRSQAYILIKHGYSVRDTAQLIGKSSFLSRSGQNVVRYLRGMKGSGRPSKISSKILTTLEKSKYKRHQSTRKLSRKLKHSGLIVCKSSVHNYLKKEFGTQSIQKETPATSYRKNNVKIDLDLQRNTKICLKNNGMTMCLVTNHQCICFINKIEKMTLFGETRTISSCCQNSLKECVCKYLGGNVSKWTFSNPYYAPGTNGRRGVLC